MPFQEHELFEPPENRATPLFRYVDLAKFVSLLRSSSLFFARSDRLGDSFEGSMTRANLDFRPELYPQMTDHDWRSMIRMRQAIRSWTFLNCWTAAPTESIAMWRLYVGGGNGLAIESSYTRLTQVLGYEKPVFVGAVKYVNWDQRLIPEGSTFAPFLYKRNGFEYEHEVRAMIQDMPALPNMEPDWDRPVEPGRNVPVEVRHLITRVRLSPVSDPWYHEVVHSVIEKFGYDFEVVQSDLAGEPVF
jgi:hypothetical protein